MKNVKILGLLTLLALSNLAFSTEGRGSAAEESAKEMEKLCYLVKTKDGWRDLTQDETRIVHQYLKDKINLDYKEIVHHRELCTASGQCVWYSEAEYKRMILEWESKGYVRVPCSRITWRKSETRWTGGVRPSEDGKCIIVTTNRGEAHVYRKVVRLTIQDC